jgi:hypothetical protein
LGEVGIGHITARQELREMIAGLGIPEPEPTNESRRAALLAAPADRPGRGAMTPHDFTHFNPTILREYDIRGIVGDTLTEADAYALGRSYARWRTAKAPHASPSAATAAPIRRMLEAALVAA